MANVNTAASATTTVQGTGESYKSALMIITTLFFMWGSLTSLNDVLIPYAQHVFKLRLAASMLIQTAFFSAYFVFSIPAARVIDWIGYKKSILVGLGTMVLACLAFYPAAKVPSFAFFLVALIILATGITVLQVAANPYVAILGNPRTASSRLNLTQAFNSLGTTIFPWIGAHLILRTATAAISQSTSQEADAVIKLYVYFFATALTLLAIGIGLAKLPKIESAERHVGEKIVDSVWKHPNLVFGAVGIFVYVGGEVAIGSAIANYLALDNIGRFISPASIPDAASRYRAALAEGAKYISFYWGGAMVGRFIGSALLQKIKAGNAELGPLTGDGSGILNMAIVGGAIIPWMVGKLGDVLNHQYYPAMTQGETSWGQGIHYALLVTVLCYLYILFFALSGSRTNSERGVAS